MSLLDLFRSQPPSKPEPKTTPPAPAPAPYETAHTAVAVMEPPPGPSPEEIRQQERAEQLATLRATVDSEAIGIEALADAYKSDSSPRTSAAIQAEIDATQQQLKSMTERHEAALKELLPIEQMLDGQLRSEYSRHSDTYRRRLNSLGLELVTAKLDEAYQRIDMSFMRRRKWSAKHECAMPLFAMFNVDKPVCTIEGHARSDSRRLTRQVLADPPILAKLVPETAAMLEELAAKDLQQWHSRARCISSRFAGAIPQEIRTKIKAARPQFEQIYIVTESPEWDMESFEAQSGEGVYTRLNPKPIPQRDPLVIGEKNGKFWLIAVFDTTPAEEYVAREFTSDRLVNTP